MHTTAQASQPGVGGSRWFDRDFMEDFMRNLAWIYRKADGSAEIL